MYYHRQSGQFFEPDLNGVRAKSNEFAGPFRCKVVVDDVGAQTVTPLETQPQTNDDLSAGLPDEPEGNADGDANPDVAFGSG